jgi:Zn-finger nucleic acid-binding protein
MLLTCPQCTDQMKEVTARATVGYSIVLDQCPRCGGIWCDRWELYPLTAAAADRLDPVDRAALQQPTPVRTERLACPRCRARMQRLRDPSLPQDACIERCPNCDGMWLNRGELRRFKRRDLSAGALARTPTDAQIDQLAQEACPVVPATPVSHLADAFDAVEPTPGVGAVREEILSGAAWLIARTALRLLLHI